jgi:hypothetical protein
VQITANGKRQVLRSMALEFLTHHDGWHRTQDIAAAIVPHEAGRNDDIVYLPPSTTSN